MTPQPLTKEIPAPAPPLYRRNISSMEREEEEQPNKRSSNFPMLSSLRVGLRRLTTPEGSVRRRAGSGEGRKMTTRSSFVYGLSLLAIFALGLFTGVSIPFSPSSPSPSCSTGSHEMIARSLSETTEVNNRNLLSEFENILEERLLDTTDRLLASIGASTVLEREEARDLAAWTYNNAKNYQNGKKNRRRRHHNRHLDDIDYEDDGARSLSRNRAERRESAARSRKVEGGTTTAPPTEDDGARSLSRNRAERRESAARSRKVEGGTTTAPPTEDDGVQG